MLSFFDHLGLETRFGLSFPKYKSTTSNQSTSSVPPSTTVLGKPTPQQKNSSQ